MRPWREIARELASTATFDHDKIKRLSEELNLAIAEQTDEGDLDKPKPAPPPPVRDF